MSKEIPPGWKWIQLGTIANTSSGGTPSRRNSRNFGGDIPWVKSGELGDGHVFVTEESITQFGLDNSSAKIFPKGTLCIALYGATVGRLGILEIEAATNQAVCAIFLPENVERSYVYYYLFWYRPKLVKSAKGGAQPNISQEIIKSIWLPLPPIAEQKSIVVKLDELLSDLDVGLANLLRAQANLKRYRASLLKAAVEGRFTAEWRAKSQPGETGEQLLARILKDRRVNWEAEQLAKFSTQGKEPPKNWRDKYVEPAAPIKSDLPALPEGWCWASINQLLSASLTNGRSVQTREGGFPVLRLTAIKGGRIDLLETKAGAWSREEASPFLVTDGDFLFSRGNGSISLLGRGGLVHTEGAPCVAFPDTMIRMRLSSNFFLTELIPFWWDSKPVRAQIEKSAKTSAGIHKISQDDVREIVIPVPPMEEQVKIYEVLTNLLETNARVVASLNSTSLKAKMLRQSVLEAAFEGRLTRYSEQAEAIDLKEVA
ncbi:restriction endonuclease subunit S [Cupriavidus necator]